MTPAEHRAEADRLVRLCYTAEPISDELLPDITISGGDRYANVLAAAQVHATLALSPAPAAAPAGAPPQRRWDLTRPAYIPDVTGGRLSITPSADRTGLVFNYDEDAWLIENPDTLRDLASLLTAHADRLEKP